MQLLQAIRKDPVGLCVVVVLALMIVVLLARPAHSHSWYDPDCCSDRDCEPVSTVSFVASDPKSVPVSIFFAPPKRPMLDALEAAGVERAIFGLPSEGRDAILPRLDAYVAAMKA